MLKEQVIEELEMLNEDELQQVADYLAFLRFRSRVHTIPPYNRVEAKALYAEFADEDRKIAEEGMADYYQGLLKEDAQ